MVGIFIIARLESTRLKQKHLIKVNDKTLIEWLVERYYNYFEKEINDKLIKIFIVTSNTSENKKFEQLFSKNKQVKVFFGSDVNIPLRLYQCAEANNISDIISVDGDDILCSTSASALVIDQLKKGENIIKTHGLPLGMNVIGFKKTYLNLCLKNLSSAKLETGWGKIFKDSDINSIKVESTNDNLQIRATLDYKEDGLFFKTIIEYFQEKILKLDDKNLIQMILKKKWYEINNSLNEEYWRNFYKQKKSE